MKILLTTDCYTPTVNGVVTSVLNLKRGLELRGHEVRVLTLSGTIRSYCDGDTTYIGSFDAGKIYPGTRVRSAMGSKYIRDILRWAPDIVHSQCEFSTFFLAKRIAKKVSSPLIHTYHTVYEDYTHYFSPSKKIGKRAVITFSNWVSDHVDCIIAPTQKVQHLLNGYGVSAPVRVVPSGIDLSRFSSVPEERVASLRSQLQIPPNHTVLVSVSRLAEEKNLDEILRTFSKCPSLKATLVMVGDGPYRASLEQQAAALGVKDRIRFTGMIPPEQVPAYYRLGDLFVSASTSETQGLTYIEALAAGVPILCRQDDCVSPFLDDGKNGWAYQTEQEFLDKLHWFMDHVESHQTMRACAAESAKVFSIETFAEQVESIYFGLLKMRREGIEVCLPSRLGANMMSAVSLGSLIICLFLCIYGYQMGLLTSVDTLRASVNGAGVVGVLLFVLIQAVQVVVPIIPGGIGCLAGVLIFGPLWGFVYNYIGICAGSMMAFAIAKCCGRPLLSYLFPKRMIDRYSRWTMENHRFTKFFAAAIFFPVAPDDFLCYLAGTTPMPLSHYTAIIWLGKPFSIALYSLGLTVVWQRLLPLFVH